MTNFKDKYPIGSQWECRDGSRAVVVYHDLIARSMKCYSDLWGEVFWYGTSGNCYKQSHDLQLIAPWKEKRVEEIELIMIRHTNGTTATITSNEYSELLYTGNQILARKKITITEGEGMS